MLRERQVELLRRAGAPSMTSPEAADLQPGFLLRPVWVANTFFFSKLTEDTRQGATITEHGYCYAGVARWTKREKVNVFACRLLLVPLNFGNSHWALGVIVMATKRIEVWDSINGGGNEEAARTLLHWLGDEFKNKNPPGASFDADEWDVDGRPSSPAPQQENYSDCGCFMLANVDFFLLGHVPNFLQTFIPHFRRHIARACLTGSVNAPARNLLQKEEKIIPPFPS